MRTERRLLNKYADLITCMSAGTLSFKKKDEIIEVNMLLKEISILKRRLLRETLMEDTEDLQMKIKFKKR